MQPGQEHWEISLKSRVCSGRAGLRKMWVWLRSCVQLRLTLTVKSCRTENLLCFVFFLSFVIVLHRLFHHNQDGDVFIKKEVGSLFDKTRASSPCVLLCSSTYYKDLIISQRHRWNTFFHSSCLLRSVFEVEPRCLHFHPSTEEYTKGQKCNSDTWEGWKNEMGWDQTVIPNSAICLPAIL